MNIETGTIEQRWQKTTLTARDLVELLVQAALNDGNGFIGGGSFSLEVGDVDNSDVTQWEGTVYADANGGVIVDSVHIDLDDLLDMQVVDLIVRRDA